LRYYLELPEFVRKIMQTQMVLPPRHVDSLRSKTENENRSQSHLTTLNPATPIAGPRTAAEALRLAGMPSGKPFSLVTMKFCARASPELRRKCFGEHDHT